MFKVVKGHLSASVDHIVLRDFADYCRGRHVNKSSLIEGMLREFLRDPEENLKRIGGGIE